MTWRGIGNDGRGRRLTVGTIGAAAGVLVHLDVAVSRSGTDVDLSAMAAPLAGAAVLGIGILLALRASTTALIAALAPAALRSGSAYRRFEPLSYVTFLLVAAGIFGVHVSIPLGYGILLSFAAAQLALAVRSVPSAPAERFLASNAWLAVLFAVSGMAALVYEIVWQRVLYAAYGINIESVTLIVAVFMLGLGLGALMGGWASERFPSRLPELFAAAELTIGLFGAASIPLIEAVAERTLHLSMAGVAATVFALMLLPTLLMGATLPILVAYTTRRDPHVGGSVGRLYGANTLGAALASLLTVDVLFVLMGQQAAVWFAVALNVTVGLLVYRMATGLRRGGTEAGPSSASEVSRAQPPRPSVRWPPLWVLATSATVGFVSLSQEILWVRVISFAMLGIPQVFGHVLGFFLIGVALGARDARRLCDASSTGVLTVIASRMLAAAVAIYVSIPLVAQVMAWSKPVGLVVAYLAVGLGAYLLGVVLPVLAHLAAARGAAPGATVAWVYVANVAGSTAGPLVTAFVLMDRLSLEQCALALSLVTLFAGSALWLAASRPAPKSAWGVLALSSVSAVLFPGVHSGVYAQLFEKLLHGEHFRVGSVFRRVVQNRSGVIVVQPDPKADILYAGGHYDGCYNIDPRVHANGIDRAYLFASLHRNPRRVLMIGLATGSWTRVVAAHEAVQHITVVEINPGYEELLRDYGGHARILDDPRIAYEWNDGRRWLRRNPTARFDFILINTPQHYRANITNLLSREFLELCQQHLEPDGVLYYNTTRSPDAVYTAATVFRHVTMFGNFVAASARPMAMTREERRGNLRRFSEDGHPLLDAENVERLASKELPDVGEALRARHDLRVVTDDNMLTEFKRVDSDILLPRLYAWYDPSRSWLPAARRDR